VTARDVVACAFLAVAVLVVAASATGVAAMPGAARKLHYITPAAVVAPVAVIAAIIVVNGLDYATAQSLITLGLAVFAGPFLSHATIRALRAREERRTERQRERAGQKASQP
jgi:multisubunit Na+/H+ antiporter MnhG subunit